MEPQLLADLFDLPDGAAWQAAAACADTDPETFTTTGHEHVAALICRRCPVQTACLDYALEHDERFGVWGGLSPRERERLRRRR